MTRSKNEVFVFEEFEIYYDLCYLFGIAVKIMLNLEMTQDKSHIYFITTEMKA